MNTTPEPKPRKRAEVGIIPTGRQYYTTGDLITRTGFSYAFWSTLRTKREGPPFITVSTRKTLSTPSNPLRSGSRRTRP